jgi:hypothetical protein
LGIEANLQFIFQDDWMTMSVYLLLLYGIMGFLVACRSSNAQTTTLIGQPFPRLSGESLASQPMTFPDSTIGKVTLLVVAFKQGAQPQCDAWRNAWTPLGNGFAFYEIPMLASGWKMMSGWIDGGMRSGIVKDLHDNVVTYYGALDDYQRQFGVIDDKLAFAFLLDQNGIVRWQGTGFPTENDIAALSQTAQLLQGPK